MLYILRRSCVQAICTSNFTFSKYRLYAYMYFIQYCNGRKMKMLNIGYIEDMQRIALHFATSHYSMTFYAHS